MAWCRLLGALIVVAVAAAGAPPAASAAERAGEVLAFSGSCFVETGGTKTVLKNGDVVNVGDTVEVPTGAKLKLRMIDGTIVAAASGTRVSIESYASDSKARDVSLNLASGLLRAVVSSVSQPSKFEVQTATGVAAVRSTDWFIEAQPGMTQVGVLVGAVGLTSAATKRDVRIPARWGARLEAGRNPVPARVWTQAEFDAVISRTDVD